MQRGQLLTDEMYLEAIEEHGDEFDARMGAEAVYELLRTIEPGGRDRQGARKGGTLGDQPKRLSKRLKLSSRRRVGQQARVDGHDGAAGAAAGSAAAGALDGGRLRLGPERPVPPCLNRNNRLAAAAGPDAPDIIVRTKSACCRSGGPLLDNGRRGRAITAPTSAR